MKNKVEQAIYNEELQLDNSDFFRHGFEENDFFDNNNGNDNDNLEYIDKLARIKARKRIVRVK